MRLRITRKLAIAAVAVAVIAVAGGVYAITQGSSSAQPANSTIRGGARGGMQATEFDAAAAYLGIPNADMQNELHSGKSLAQIAGERGKSVDGLKQAMTATAHKGLDAQVARGQITGAQEQRLLGSLPARIDAVVQAPGGAPFRGRGPRRGGGRYGPPPGAPYGTPPGPGSST